MKNLAYAIRPLALDMLSTFVFAVLIAVTAYAIWSGRRRKTLAANP